MKRFTGIAFVFIAVNASAIDVQHWRCKAERTVGVDVSNDFKPTNFTDRNEYRILPVDAVLKPMDDIDRELLEMLLRNAQEQDEGISSIDGYALARSLLESPMSAFSWEICTVNEASAKLEKETFDDMTFFPHPAYQSIECDSSGLDFSTLTKRFVRSVKGQWRNADDDGRHVLVDTDADNDFWFEFGTCKPYSD